MTVTQPSLTFDYEPTSPEKRTTQIMAGQIGPFGEFTSNNSPNHNLNEDSILKQTDRPTAMDIMSIASMSVRDNDDRFGGEKSVKSLFSNDRGDRGSNQKSSQRSQKSRVSHQSNKPQTPFSQGSNSKAP